jgi:hypothetical protein
LGVREFLDIANINFVKPYIGKGVFSRLLDRIEPLYPIYVECIINKRLADYLERRRYHKVEAPHYGGSPSMWRRKRRAKTTGLKRHKKVQGNSPLRKKGRA